MRPRVVNLLGLLICYLFTQLSPENRFKIMAAVAVVLRTGCLGPEDEVMYSRSSPSDWNGFFREFRCRHCGSDAGYRSRPRSFLEKYLAPALFLRPVRCGDCYRRTLRPVSVPLREKRKAVVVDHEQAITSLDATLRVEPPKETASPAAKRARIA